MCNEECFKCRFTVEVTDDGGLKLTPEPAVPGIEGFNVNAEVFASLGLFDESRKGFTSYEADSELAAQIVAVAAEINDWVPEMQQEMTLAVSRVCSPGAPYQTIPTVRLVRYAP